MDRPTWVYRHGVPDHVRRWRPLGHKVTLRYRTLDVDPDDVDNFYAVAGRLTAEPAWDEVLSISQEWRRKSQTYRHRIGGRPVYEVREYLKVKAWRDRLRRASGDFAWAIEPYRKRWPTLLANPLPPSPQEQKRRAVGPAFDTEAQQELTRKIREQGRIAGQRHPSRGRT